MKQNHKLVTSYRACLWLLVCFFGASATSILFASKQVTVGSKAFTENRVLGEAIRLTLEESEVEVTHRRSMGGTFILWQALLEGSIDIYVDYSGTIAATILNRKVAMPLDDLRQQVQQRYPVAATDTLGFNNGYSLVMKKKHENLSKISHLLNYPDFIFGMTHEFINRADGWIGLKNFYGLPHKNVRGFEHSLSYIALSQGEIDLKEAYTTDPKIVDLDLFVLEDDKKFFPSYQAVILYRTDLPAEVITALKKLERTISTTKMRSINSFAEKAKDDTLAAMRLLGFDEDRPAHSLLGQAEKILELVKQHLWLVCSSLLLAILVGLPLGIIASRPGRLSSILLSTAGVFQTIPSLALLAMLVPIFGISKMTAITALFLYSLLPIMHNTAIGLQSITGTIREAARVIGLEPIAQLRLVYLPIALPTILAGIKTSMVINIGTATLAALLGIGGLGEPILIGLSLNDYPTILSGAIPAALLAVICQTLFSWVEKRLIPLGIRLENK